MKIYIMASHSKKTNVYFWLTFLSIFFLYCYCSKAQQVITYSYTGANQVFTVPAHATKIQVELWGAQGQSSSSSAGGNGGYVKGLLNVVPGQTLLIAVGGQSGFNGGGAANQAGSGSGGGATDIRQGGSTLFNRVAVAGGGGGAGVGCVSNVSDGGFGGYPGGTGGEANAASSGSGTMSGGGSVAGGQKGGSRFCPSSARGGAGGGQDGGGGQGGQGSTGANGGTLGNCGSQNTWVGGANCAGSSSGAGCFGIGGAGGASSSCSGIGGGGGGGGWYGGGGGGQGGSASSGGGGGSSYLGSLQDSSWANNSKTGDGLVTITLYIKASLAKKNISCFGTNNGSATVSVVSSYTNTTYQWLPSGGTSSVATGLAAGIYTSKVSNAAGTVQTTFTITSPANLSVTTNSISMVSCYGGTNGAVSLSVSGGIPPYTYTWSPQTNSTSNTNAISDLAAGIYTCVIADSANCLIQKTVTIAEPPDYWISAAASQPTLCEGDSTILSATGALTYTWTGGITNGVAFSPTVSGTYSVVGSNSAGCLSSGIETVMVTVYPNPVVSVSSGSVCAGSAFSITATGADSYSYSTGSSTFFPVANDSIIVIGTDTTGCVSLPAVGFVTVNPLPIIGINSGSICTGQSFTLQGSGAATYSFSSGSPVVSPAITSSYSVSGISPEGCLSATDAVTSVTVHALPQVSVNSGSICSGDAFTISPIVNGASSYSISGASFVVNPTQQTSYTITAISPEGCVNDKVTATVSVQPLPAVSVASSPELICAGEQASLSASGAQSYSWSTGSTNNQIVVSPSVSTTYSLSGTDANGCSMQVVMTQSVSECLGLTANDQNTAASLSVFPNPSSGTIVIQTTEELEIELVNELGQVLENLRLAAGNGYQLKIESLSEGVYLVKAKNKGTVIIKKVIVTRD